MADRSRRPGEAGFTLIEALVCVGLLATVGASAVVGFASTAATGTTPTGALTTNGVIAREEAQRVMARARAVAAYVPSGSHTLLELPSLAQTTPFVPHAQFVRTIPGTVPESTLTLNIATTATYVAADERWQFTISMSYADPRQPGGIGNLSLSSFMPRPTYIPGTTFTTRIGEPMRM